MTPNSGSSSNTDSSHSAKPAEPSPALTSSNSTSSHNPFYIGSLPDLSRSRFSHPEDDQSTERDRQEKSAKDLEKEKRRSKRRSLINAGRSLSPFRHHSRTSSSSLKSKKEEQEKEKESEDLSASIVTVKGGDSGKEKKGSKLDESDSERDSKWSSRLCPRNNAFSSYEQDDDDEEDVKPRARPVRKGTGWNPNAPSQSQVKIDMDISSIKSASLVEGPLLDEPKKEEVADMSRPSVESERSVDTYDSSIASDLDSDAAAKERERDDDSDGDSQSTSSELSFDPELLDNTLFNAGCLDLHGAWQSGGTTSSRPSSIAGGTDMERQESHDHNHSSSVPGTSAPSAYDDLWGHGAGTPSSHQLINEQNDDNLEAPNVVLPSAPLNAHSIGHTNARTFDQIHEHSPARSKSPRPSKSSNESNGTEERSTAALQAMGKEHTAPQDPSHALSASRPFFERNRCTITLIHGEYEKKAKASKRPKRYIVASDGSE